MEMQPWMQMLLQEHRLHGKQVVKIFGGCGSYDIFRVKIVHTGECDGFVYATRKEQTMDMDTCFFCFHSGKYRIFYTLYIQLKSTVCTRL